MAFRRKKKSARLAGANKIEQTFVKLYSEDELNVTKTFDVEKLKLIVAEQNAYVMKAKSEMEANPEFQVAKQKIDDFRGAFSDTRKFADSKKLLALYLLQTRGVVDMGEDESDSDE
jgi:hypothetical protein